MMAFSVLKPVVPYTDLAGLDRHSHNIDGIVDICNGISDSISATILSAVDGHQCRSEIENVSDSVRLRTALVYCGCVGVSVMMDLEV